MTKSQVLKFLKECRDTHVAWVNHYVQYPSQHKRSITKLAGTKRQNQRIADQYDAAIAFVRSL